MRYINNKIYFNDSHVTVSDDICIIMGITEKIKFMHFIYILDNFVYINNINKLIYNYRFQVYLLHYSKLILFINNLIINGRNPF